MKLVGFMLHLLFETLLCAQETGSVEQCLASEFTEDPAFFLNFSSSSNANIKQLIASIVKEQSAQNIWNLINNQGVNCNHVQTWIFYLLHHGTLTESNFEENQRALYAAWVYFVLLAQPGSSGNQFHHPVLFERALSTFRIACTIGSQSRSKKSKATQSTAEQTSLTLKQELVLLDDFADLLKDFCSLLQVYPLKNRLNELKQSVEAFVQVIKSFAASTLQIPASEGATFMPPSQRSFNGLQTLIHTKHGNIPELSTLVFRLLMTTITMRHALASATALPRWAIKQAETAVDFVLSVYNDHGQDVSHPVWRLCQNLIAQCPDRAESRTHVSNFVMRIIDQMPIAWYADFLGWLQRFVNHSKSYRSGGLSLIHNILTKPEKSLTDQIELTDDQKANLSHKQLVQIVLATVSDAYPTIRAKSLLILATALVTVSPTVFIDLLQTDSNLASPIRERSKTSIEGVVAMEASEETPLFTPAVLNSVPVSSIFNFQLVESNLFSLLSDRACEEKYTVRKNAVVALEAAICVGFIPATKETLLVLEERCRDPLLSIRKAAIQSLTNVLSKYPDNVNVQHSWMKCLLPSVLDAETSMQDKAVQLIETTILSELEKKGSLVWNLLLYLTRSEFRQNRVYLRKVTKEWHNQGKLKSSISNALLNNFTETKKKDQTWMLLCIITSYAGDESIATKIVRQWKIERDLKTPICLQMDMISTLGNAAKYMSAEDKADILGILQKDVENGSCPIQLVGYCFETIYEIVKSNSSDRTSCQATMESWCSKLLSKCETALSNVVITQSQHRNFNEDGLINHLYVVGEAAQRSDNVPKRVKLSIQALLTNTNATDNDVQSQPLSQFGAEGIPPSIRAHAIFNLGRMCFRDESLAKKCTPAIARELEGSSEECRNNALVILTDLCILQTQLVDPFLQEMANCLGDSSVTVRKQAVILVSSLLQKEFVKWKDSLLFKFLSVACDDCIEIRSLARHLLLDQLLRGIQVSGSLFYRNFVACLFYFNTYDGHSVHKYVKSPREKKYFDLSKNFAKRMEIYEFMLINMEDQHRINLTGKICSDVLDSFVENKIPLNNQTRNLLTDTLAVLCCKEIRLKCIRSRDENELEDEVAAENPAEQMRVMQNVAKHKVILQTVKLNLVENIIPIIIALKNMLTELKSPLVKNVMLYLKEVMKEYRKEVNVMLSADKQLASEIEFDLKRFEREQEAAKLPSVQPVALVVPDAPPSNSATPRARKSVPSTPSAATPANRFNFVTPATARRRSRPINVEAILKSAQKIASESPLPKPPVQTSPEEREEPTLVPATPKDQHAATRAASTPQTSSDPNLTFAARDLSVIAGPGGRETMLMLTLKKTISNLHLSRVGVAHLHRLRQGTSAACVRFDRSMKRTKSPPNAVPTSAPRKTWNITSPARNPKPRRTSRKSSRSGTPTTDSAK